jgi:hypothetical protein
MKKLVYKSEDPSMPPRPRKTVRKKEGNYRERKRRRLARDLKLSMPTPSNTEESRLFQTATILGINDLWNC